MAGAVIWSVVDLLAPAFPFSANTRLEKKSGASGLMYSPQSPTSSKTFSMASPPLFSNFSTAFFASHNPVSSFSME